MGVGTSCKSFSSVTKIEVLAKTINYTFEDDDTKLGIMIMKTIIVNIGTIIS